MTPCQTDLALRRDIAHETGTEIEPTPYDVLTDEPVGARFYAARSEARAMCRECLIAATCLPAHLGEFWALAVLGIPVDRPAHIRQWATDNGYHVSGTGQLRAEVRAAYYAAEENAS